MPVCLADQRGILAGNDFVSFELFKTHFGGCHILESPDEELILIRLQKEPEYHHDHAVLSAQFIPHNALLTLSQVSRGYALQNHLESVVLTQLLHFLKPVQLLICKPRGGISRVSCVLTIRVRGRI
jgi:hypothetical protein